MNKPGKTLLALALMAMTAMPALAQQKVPLRSGIAGLMSNASVQEELRLTEAQKAQAVEVYKKADAWILDALKNLEGQERFAKAHELSKEKEASILKGLEDVLKPEQFARMNGIRYQARGPLALEEEDLQQALKLTAVQKASLVSLRQEMEVKLLEAVQAGKNDAGAIAAKIGDVRKSALAKAEAILTDEQKGEYVKILGPPFKGHLDGPNGGGRIN